MSSATVPKMSESITISPSPLPTVSAPPYASFEVTGGNAGTTSIAGKTCPACGSMNSASASYCADCGSEMDAMDTVNGPEDYAWEGLLGLEGAPTDDGRILMTGQIDQRELPLPFRVQLESGQGHDGSPQAGRIESIDKIPVGEFDKEGFELGEDVPDNAVAIWATGVLNGEHADKAKQMIENGSGVSLDLPRDKAAIIDPDTLEEVDPAEVNPLDMWSNKYLEGIGGKIAGVTLVDIPAFPQAKVRVTDGVLVASGQIRLVPRDDSNDAMWIYVGPEGEDYKPPILTASAGPLKPPRSWFENPNLTKLTPLQITKEGRVFGHLADWNGCHTGFQGICVPPFRSPSNYAFFNVGEIETAEGDLVPCGKLMFSMDGAGHADTNPSLGYEQVMRYYDDATHVGAFVRAGSDRYGTWLAGSLRSGLSEVEIQHLRTHPPSGDWRPLRGGLSDLLAAFSVPIPGFPIARGENQQYGGMALVASAGGEISAIITGPLELTEADGARSRMRRKKMIGLRLREAFGIMPKNRAEMRAEAMAWAVDGFKDYPAADRRRMAKSGAAMPDGSFPIANCDDAMNARRAIGRADPSKRPAVERHIASRERALGCKKSAD